MGGGPRCALETASLSDRGRSRATNQDECAEFESEAGLRLLVVADGMGGHAGGEVASRMAVESIGASFRADTGAPEEILRRAFQTANTDICREARREPRLLGMGTTGVALLVDPQGVAWVAHVGDSRAYRLRQGRLERLTDDHSWVFEEVHRGRLTPEEAQWHPRRNALLRSLGVEEGVEVDVRRIELAPGDRVLLCSDGLWGELGEAEIAAALAGSSPRDAARALVDLANRAGGSDNITVQVAALGAGARMGALRAWLGRLGAGGRG